MSQFYGTIDGNARTQATRRGTKNSGLVTHAAGWSGSIRVELFENNNGEDCYRVYLAPWRNSGGYSKLLSEGRLDSSLAVQ